MATFVAFSAPDPSADYSFSVADTKTGNSFSPSLGSFAAAPGDELVKMARDLSPNRAAQRYGFIPLDLVPPTRGQYLVYVHPAAGGPPVDKPFPLVQGRSPSRSFNFGVTF